nr:transposase [Serratia proteamaculans]
MLKPVFHLILCRDSLIPFFALMKFLCPDYSCVSRRTKSPSIPFKKITRGEIVHLVINSTGLKVFG